MSTRQHLQAALFYFLPVGTGLDLVLYKMNSYHLGLRSLALFDMDLDNSLVLEKIALSFRSFVGMRVADYPQVHRPKGD